MPTINKPVRIHVPVDKMYVMLGPSGVTLRGIPSWGGGGDPKENTVIMSLRTDASPHRFQRRVFITDVQEERESLFEAMGRDDFEPWDFKLAGNLLLRGCIDSCWDFSGTYNPQTRKGTLLKLNDMSEEF